MVKRVEQLAEEIAGEAQTQENLNGLMRLMMKSALQRMLDTELEVHLGRRSGSTKEGSEVSSAEGSDVDSQPVQTGGNHRNGYSQKTVKGDMGQLTLDIPRDRKELLGLRLSENEGAKFWLSVLTDMKPRGLKDIFVACIDGLSGFADAIHTAYPQTKVQLCVVHLVRAALRTHRVFVLNISRTIRRRRTVSTIRPIRHRLRDVSDKDSKAVARDLKKIDNAATRIEAEEFAQAWDENDPTIAKSWRAKWTDIITLFDFPCPIRKAISTTNVIESVNRVIRKLTRNRKISPHDDSAFQIIDMAINEASKKWTMPIAQWKPAPNHFAILFENRLPE